MKTIEISFLLFIIYSCLGWCIETCMISLRTKEFVNRGFLIGPYCPIYGFCSVIMINTLGEISNPFLLFIIAMFICSFCEYFTSYFMEKLFNARWWDYSNYKFHINGRICLKNTLCFGLLGVLLIYLINPFIKDLLFNINTTLLHFLFIILFTLFIVDLIVSYSIILKIKDLSIKYIHIDNTKEIAKKVREFIKSSWLNRRILHAYPNLKLTIIDKINDMKILKPLPIIKNKRK